MVGTAQIAHGIHVLGASIRASNLHLAGSIQTAEFRSPMPEKCQRSLADPSLLSPRDEDDKQLFKVVVETPRAVATNVPSILTIECSN